jgi:hypothetical protein
MARDPYVLQPVPVSEEDAWRKLAVLGLIYNSLFVAKSLHSDNATPFSVIEKVHSRTD